MEITEHAGLGTRLKISKNTQNTVVKIPQEIPRGRPKSGRVWKTVRKERFSTIKKDKMFKTSWDKKVSLRDEKKRLKELQEHLKTEKDREKQLRRERMEANKKRKLENQRKSEIVQPIKNTAKIKRMKKKQLRSIETR
ncbi:unnamed protein product [Lymnaea stagnalis]|uniref:Coiled-coil domain-containing protein 86 n=1 Tax=Lymnaea stagnalis TaxID=6523 RepID=A0AAV2I1P2_LYMST